MATKLSFKNLILKEVCLKDKGRVSINQNHNNNNNNNNNNNKKKNNSKLLQLISKSKHTQISNH
jgi:hypothetical protein